MLNNGLIVVLLVAFIGASFSSCQQTAKQTSSEDPISDSVEIPLEDTFTVISDLDSATSVADSSISQSGPSSNEQEFQIREGKHGISLQWISWDQLGEAEIKSLSNGTYHIAGEQTNPKNDDYLKIEGTLEPISKNELKFVGTVITQSESVNNGKPCSKDGEQLFLSTKNRKYWRMQNMENCEGGMVVDYVDIYF